MAVNLISFQFICLKNCTKNFLYSESFYDYKRVHMTFINIAKDYIFFRYVHQLLYIYGRTVKHYIFCITRA